MKMRNPDRKLAFVVRNKSLFFQFYIRMNHESLFHTQKLLNLVAKIKTIVMDFQEHVFFISAALKLEVICRKKSHNRNR